MQLPKVSIILPSYNHSRYLVERMDSIFAQTFGDFELLVLDDASSDDSYAKLLRYYGRLNGRMVVNMANSGSAFPQWNYGISLARGEYVWIAESDDCADERFLEKLVPLLDDHPEVGLAYCASQLIDTESRPIGDSLGWTSDLEPLRWNSAFVNSGTSEVRRYMVVKNTVPNASAVLLRRSILMKTMPIDASFKLCGDWLQWGKVLLRSDVAYIPQLLNRWRVESSNSRVLAPGLLEWKEGRRVVTALARGVGYSEAETSDLVVGLANRCMAWLEGHTAAAK